MNSTKKSIGTVLAALFILAGCSSSKNNDTSLSFNKEETQSASATVENVNYSDRIVTLRRDDGTLTTLKVGPEVRNLPQVKVGDVVTVTYHEELSATVVKPEAAKPGRINSETVGRAKLGEKPGGTAVQTQSVVSTIENVNTSAKTVTVRKPEGDLVTLPVEDIDALSKLKVGDRAVVNYTEAMSISVKSAE